MILVLAWITLFDNGLSAKQIAPARSNDLPAVAFQYNQAAGSKIVVVDELGNRQELRAPRTDDLLWVDAWKSFAWIRSGILVKLTLSGKTSPVLDLRSLEPAEAAESRFLACSISSDARYLYYKKSPSYDSFVVDLRHRTLVAKLTKASLLRKTHSRSHEEPFRITSCFSPSGTQVAFSIAADKRIGIEQVDSEAKCILWEWKTGDIKTISPGAPVAFTDATHILMRDSAKRPIVRIVDLAGKETWRRSPVASTSFSWPYILIAEGLKAAYLGNHPTGWVEFVDIRSLTAIKRYKVALPEHGLLSDSFIAVRP